MRKINVNGAIPYTNSDLYYTFDTGIYISSLFDLYEITKDENILYDAEKSLSWLISQWDGNYFSAVNKKPLYEEWYHQSSVHLTKLAIPLLKASTYMQNSEYAKITHKLLDNYCKLQFKAGNFQINEYNSLTMSHPHCYATEAYLYAYYYTKNEKYLNIVKRASEWLRNNQNQDGSLYRIYYDDNDKVLNKYHIKTSDATAQAIRIWKLLGINYEEIEKAYSYLSKQVKGGLRLLNKDSLKYRVFTWRRKIYSWPTFFYIHSLLLPFGQIKYCKELY